MNQENLAMQCQHCDQALTKDQDRCLSCGANLQISESNPGDDDPFALLEQEEGSDSQPEVRNAATTQAQNQDSTQQAQTPVKEQEALPVPPVETNSTLQQSSTPPVIPKSPPGNKQMKTSSLSGQNPGALTGLQPTSAEIKKDPQAAADALLQQTNLLNKPSNNKQVIAIIGIAIFALVVIVGSILMLSFFTNTVEELESSETDAPALETTN